MVVTAIDIAFSFIDRAKGFQHHAFHRVEHFNIGLIMRDADMVLTISPTTSTFGIFRSPLHPPADYPVHKPVCPGPTFYNIGNLYAACRSTWRSVTWNTTCFARYGCPSGPVTLSHSPDYWPPRSGAGTGQLTPTGDIKNIQQCHPLISAL